MGYIVVQILPANLSILLLHSFSPLSLLEQALSASAIESPVSLAKLEAVTIVIVVSPGFFALKPVASALFAFLTSFSLSYFPSNFYPRQ